MDIVALHEQAMILSEQAPASLVREEALESATHQAKNAAWYAGASVSEIAVYLTIHIAMAPPWIDGNKRTAVMAGIQFTLINGANDQSTESYTEFADLLLNYIEADKDSRETIFKEFVEFVNGWFD